MKQWCDGMLCINVLIRTSNEVFSSNETGFWTSMYSIYVQINNIRSHKSRICLMKPYFLFILFFRFTAIPAIFWESRDWNRFRYMHSAQLMIMICAPNHHHHHRNHLQRIIFYGCVTVATVVFVLLSTCCVSALIHFFHSAMAARFVWIFISFR